MSYSTEKFKDHVGPLPRANLADEATRKDLSPAAIEGISALSKIWELSNSEVATLLGSVSERTWARMKSNEWSGTLSQDELTRASALIGLFKGLRLLFSEPLADKWIRLPNKDPLFRGASPLEAMMTGGIPAMLEARRYIDALRGGL